MRRSRAVFGAFAVVALVGSTLAINASSAGAVVVDKVTICHRTNSDNNPYVVITPDVSGVLNGHDKKHNDAFVYGPDLKPADQKWGDIIPEFDYQDGNQVVHFPGLNLTTKAGLNHTGQTGAEILANGCKFGENPPVQAFGNLLITKSVDGEVGGDPTPTSFRVHVNCDDDSVDDDFTFTGGIGGGTIAINNIKEGITCTVIELDTDTFAFGTVVTYSPAAQDGDGNDIAEIEIVKDITNNVTVTNDFPEYGDLLITKVVTGGDVAGDPTPTSFRVNVDCDDDSFDGNYTFSGGIGGGTIEIDHIREGVTCTVVELDIDEFIDGTDVDYSPDFGDHAQRTIVANITNTVTVTNDFPVPDEPVVPVEPDDVEPDAVVNPPAVAPAAVAPAAVAAAAVQVSPTFTG